MSEEATVQELKMMFEGTDIELIRMVYQQVGCNVDRAVDALLQMATDAPSGPPASDASKSDSKPSEKFPPDDVINANLLSPSKIPNNNNNTVVVIHNNKKNDEGENKSFKTEEELNDEELARQLQKQLQLEDEEQMKKDVAMAQTLYYQDIQNLQTSLNNPLPTYNPPAHNNYYNNGYHHYNNHNNEDDDDDDGSDSSAGSNPELNLKNLMQQMGPNAADELLNTIKTNMIPVISQQIKALTLPAIDENLDAPKLGPIAFGVTGVSFSDVEISPDKVTVDIEEQAVNIQVTEISAQLKPFDWYYRKEKFPKLKDSGNAKASISDTIVKVKLRIAPGGVEVADCNINVNTLDIKIGGTMASFIYNIIIAAFKSSIKKAIEDGLKGMISDAVGNQDLMG